MITVRDLIPHLLKACPSFRPSWLEHQAEISPVSGWGVDLDRFAEHVAWLLLSQDTGELPAVMAALDEVRREGEFLGLRQVATQDFLDFLEHHLQGSGVATSELLPYVRPEAMAFWTRAIASPLTLDHDDLPPHGPPRLIR